MCVNIVQGANARIAPTNTHNTASAEKHSLAHLHVSAPQLPVVPVPTNTDFTPPFTRYLSSAFHVLGIHRQSPRVPPGGAHIRGHVWGQKDKPSALVEIAHRVPAAQQTDRPPAPLGMGWGLPGGADTSSGAAAWMELTSQGGVLGTGEKVVDFGPSAVGGAMAHRQTQTP